MKASTAIPLGALFPPSSTCPPAYLPTPSFALFGPLPPTSPVHLALGYLEISDLPEYVERNDDAEDALPDRSGSKERAMIITGPKTLWTEDVMEEDEHWLRSHGSEYTTLGRLRRIDVR
jgi:hypothetical protein